MQFYPIWTQISAPMVKFLRENLEISACSNGDKFIKAMNCDKKINGGFSLEEVTFLQLHLLYIYR